jgi:hypothetical protein
LPGDWHWVDEVPVYVPPPPVVVHAGRLDTSSAGSADASGARKRAPAAPADAISGMKNRIVVRIGSVLY